MLSKSRNMFEKSGYQEMIGKRHMSFCGIWDYPEVIDKWANKNITVRYVVTKVCFDQSPESQFPSETYQSYAQYFNQRYSQKIVNMNQPLIEVRAISSKINCLLPRGKSRHGPGRRRKDEEDFEETLVPELCSLLTFPAVYMLKVTLLPSVLHRLHYLLLAEELRQKISVEVGLGQLELNCDSEWEPLKIDTTALQDQNCDVVQSTVKISDMLDFSIQAITKERYPWGDEKEPVDIEKNLNVEVKELNKAIKIDSLDNPVKLSDNLTLHKSRESQAIGPQQCEILQAITGITANDIVNYERLETLGDSFLKFAVSLSLFINFKGIDEGKLTQVKSKIIGNRNFGLEDRHGDRCDNRMHAVYYGQAQAWTMMKGRDVMDEELLRTVKQLHRNLVQNVGLLKLDKMLKGSAAVAQPILAYNTVQIAAEVTTLEVMQTWQQPKSLLSPDLVLQGARKST
ncbi:hypothetical protein AAG570_011377 [Ranatra chinensis]|uniref:Uncharacterized protein n=1 Tax=Ranatra chinensis TaxID=642074 RepID=A0ABD0YML9_9HEMI